MGRCRSTCSHVDDEPDSAHNGTYGRPLSSGLAAHIAGYGLRRRLVHHASCGRGGCEASTHLAA